MGLTKVNKNTLITGGAGFIGSAIALKLANRGYTVTVLDNLSKQIHGDDPEQSYLYRCIKDNVLFIRGDVNNRADWQRALQGQDSVIHLAAETGTGQSMYEVERYCNVNIGGTALLLDILTNQKTTIKKVLLSSSRAVYGEGKYLCRDHGTIYPKERREEDLLAGDFENKCPLCGSILQLQPTDEVSTIHPASIYGITKQVQEQMILLSCKAIHIPAVVYRYQNVYGPGQSLNNPYTGILSIFSKNILNNKSINIFEDGDESRDFVYIDDVAEATIAGIENQSADYQIFNVGGDGHISVKKIVSILKDLYGSNSEVSINGDFRLGDIRHNYADITKIKKLLKWEPKYSFPEGIQRFAEWVMREKPEMNDTYEESLTEMKNKDLFRSAVL
jgi:dTDP-L-rhamnose 4-epimerase